MAEPNHGSHGRTTFLLSGLGALMFGFGFFLVPLYGLVCDLTGIQRIAAFQQTANATGNASKPGRSITVRFDATVNSTLPWEFRPAERSKQVRLGEINEVMYVARNLSDRPVSGQAIPAVVPWQVSEHFQKIECFCFQQQTLAAGEEREMPLRFIVSPELPEGQNSLVLSYTFMGLPNVAGNAN